MKKLFIMIGSWLVLIIAVVVGSVIYENYKTSEYDAAALPYLESVIPELSEWDVEKTRRLMAPEALAKIPDEQFSAVIELFSTLGKFQSMEEPKFSQINTYEKAQSEQGTVVEYTIAAQYEHGEAEITINLLYKDDRFAIYHFNLSSKALGA